MTSCDFFLAMIVTQCHNTSHVHTRTGESHAETKRMVLPISGRSSRHFLSTSVVRSEWASRQSASVGGDRKFAGEKEGGVMLTCAGKPIGVADLAAAYRRVCGPVQRGPTRFPGIGQDAKRLGVNRVTLYRVLVGQWRLPTLASRYAELKRRAG